MNEWMNEWANEWMNEYINEWMNEWVSEWVSWWVHFSQLMKRWRKIKSIASIHRHWKGKKETVMVVIDASSSIENNEKLLKW